MRSPPLRRTLSLLGALVGGLAVTGCRVGPDYHAPDECAITAPAWRAPASPEIAAERSELAGWWQQLGSDELDTLAKQLLSQNLSLGAARQRIVQARARRGIVDADRLPHLSAGAAYFRAGTGEQSLNFQGPPPGQDVDVFQSSLTAGWELDLWGRVARLAEAADAEIGVAVEDYRGAAVALLAELAQAYVDAALTRQRIGIVQRGIELQSETERLARSRAEAGNGSRLDVEQAARELAVTRARVPTLQLALATAQNRIAVLLGERPADDVVAADQTLTLPSSVGLGLPADLLARRPDVRRAERALAASVARVGAAEAERYPKITLSGTVSLAARDVATLFGGADTVSYAVGPQLAVPLFEGGRIDSTVTERKAQASEARLAFERTLLGAIEEVENAAAGVVRTRERVAALQSAADAAEHAVSLAQELHRAGVRSLLQVIDAQRAQVTVDDDLLSAREDAYRQTIALYRALGGGWTAVPLDGELAGEVTPR